MVTLVALLLLYVWLDARVQSLGARIKKLEQQQADIHKRYDTELWKWETMKSPAAIEKALDRNRIVMVWPSESRVVRLQAPDADIRVDRRAEEQLVQLSPRSRPVAHD